jgi:RNA:NAD 2'-phosphotransferase (TPT1/KptA family)
MTEIKDHSKYEVVVHGTQQNNWDSIYKTGLNKMARKEIRI